MLIEFSKDKIFWDYWWYILFYKYSLILLRYSSTNSVFLSSLLLVISTAQRHSTKSELRYCAGSNPARSVSGIQDGEDLWQQSLLEIRLHTFRRSTISQKQFIIIIIVINCYSKNYLFLVVYNNLYSCSKRLIISLIILSLIASVF